VARAPKPANGRLTEEVLQWLDATNDTRPDAVRSQLQVWIPEYAPAVTKS